MPTLLLIMEGRVEVKIVDIEVRGRCRLREEMDSGGTCEREKIIRVESLDPCDVRRKGNDRAV